MYGEPGGLDGAVTLANVLKKLGYVTQGVGKWHMGENEGSQPQNVGFDDFYGFLSVSDMYTEWRDQYFNPEIALSPERFAAMKQLGFNHNNVHCTPEKGLENVYEIDLEKIKNLDQDWANYSEKFIKNMQKSDKPWFLYHNTRACHFDNYPNDEYAGKSPARTVYSDGMVEIDDIFSYCDVIGSSYGLIALSSGASHLSSAIKEYSPDLLSICLMEKEWYNIHVNKGNMFIFNNIDYQVV